jgi:hypothetical protein
MTTQIDCDVCFSYTFLASFQGSLTTTTTAQCVRVRVRVRVRACVCVFQVCIPG